MIPVWATRLGVCLAIAAICGWQGYRMGVAACEADHQAEALARIEAGRKLESARRQIAQERDLLTRKLEEQAHAQPVAVDRCLGPGRVRRLNAIR